MAGFLRRKTKQTTTDATVTQPPSKPVSTKPAAGGSTPLFARFATTKASSDDAHSTARIVSSPMTLTSNPTKPATSRGGSGSVSREGVEGASRRRTNSQVNLPAKGNEQKEILVTVPKPSSSRAPSLPSQSTYSLPATAQRMSSTARPPGPPPVYLTQQTAARTSRASLVGRSDKPLPGSNPQRQQSTTGTQPTRRSSSAVSPPPTRNLPLPAAQHPPSPADGPSRLPYLRQSYNSSSSQTLAPPISPQDLRTGVTPDPRASARMSEIPSEFAMFQEYSATNPSPQSTLTARGPEQQNGKPTGQAPPKNDPLALARSSSTSAEPEPEQGTPTKPLHPELTMGNVPSQVSGKLSSNHPSPNTNKDSRPHSARSQALQVPPQPRQPPPQPPQSTRKSSTSIAPVQGKARIFAAMAATVDIGDDGEVHARAGVSPHGRERGAKGEGAVKDQRGASGADQRGANGGDQRGMGGKQRSVDGMGYQQPMNGQQLHAQQMMNGQLGHRMGYQQQSMNGMGIGSQQLMNGMGSQQMANGMGYQQLGNGMQMGGSMSRQPSVDGMGYQQPMNGPGHQRSMNGMGHPQPMNGMGQQQPMNGLGPQQPMNGMVHQQPMNGAGHKRSMNGMGGQQPQTGPHTQNGVVRPQGHGFILTNQQPQNASFDSRHHQPPFSPSSPPTGPPISFTGDLTPRMRTSSMGSIRPAPQQQPQPVQTPPRAKKLSKPRHTADGSGTLHKADGSGTLHTNDGSTTSITSSVLKLGLGRSPVKSPQKGGRPTTPQTVRPSTAQPVRPSTAQGQRPGTAQGHQSQRPGTAQPHQSQRPTTAQLQRPTTAQPQRPTTAQSQRPTTAQSTAPQTQKTTRPTSPQQRPVSPVLQLDEDTIRNAGIELDEDPFARREGVKMLKPKKSKTRVAGEDDVETMDGHGRETTDGHGHGTTDGHGHGTMDGHEMESASSHKDPVVVLSPEEAKKARREARRLEKEREKERREKKEKAKEKQVEASAGVDREGEERVGSFKLAVLLSLPQVVKTLLEYLTFYDWCILSSISKEIRILLVQTPPLREEVLERFLKTVGYGRWVWNDTEPLSLSLQDLSDYMRGVSIPPHEYTRVANMYIHSLSIDPANRDPSLNADVRSLVASTRGYTRVVLRLRAQAEKEASLVRTKPLYAPSPISPSSAPASRSTTKVNTYGSKGQASRPPSRAPSPTPSTFSHSHHGHSAPPNSQQQGYPLGTMHPAPSQTSLAFRSPLFRLRRAPLLRVFVPSVEGDWLSDKSVQECEEECKRAGVRHLMRVGDVVWDVAVGDEGNVGRLVWDGSYLIDLDYTYSPIGELPKYMPALAFPPSYFHRVIRSGPTVSNPIVHVDISPWGEEIAANLQLLQDRVRTETPQGAHHNVVRWVHRSSFTIRPPTRKYAPPPPSSRGPPQAPRIPIPEAENMFVDSGWYGTIVVETEGTNEAHADLQERCGPGVFPARPRGVNGHAPPAQFEYRKVFRILRERSRPGEIWIRAVR